MQLFLTSSVLIGMLVLLRQLENYTALTLSRHNKYRFRYLTALIGTPVHELSHALVCLLARHKIHKIKLLQFNGSSTLGYVHHSFNAHSLYQQCGRFFIGIAPFLGGLLTIIIISKLTYPNYPFETIISSNQDKLLSISNLYDYLTVFLHNIFYSFEIQSELFRLGGAKFILWYFVIASILCHITPSHADMKGAISGFLFSGLLSSLLHLTTNIDFYNLALLFISLLLSILTMFFFVIIAYFIFIILIAKLLP